MSLGSEARDAGVTGIYCLPEELEDGQVDPLLLDAVRRINASGWVITAESCQGHPDATDPHAWAGNVRPMLRLVCRESDAPRLMFALATAARSERYLDPGPVGDPIPIYGSAGRLPCGIGMDVYVHDTPPGWFEALVYMHARTAWDRDRGCEAFWRLAGLVGAPLDERAGVRP